MLKPEQRRLFHKFLILEMAVQLLQRDWKLSLYTYVNEQMPDKFKNSRAFLVLL